MTASHRITALSKIETKTGCRILFRLASEPKSAVGFHFDSRRRQFRFSIFIPAGVGVNFDFQFSFRHASESKSTVSFHFDSHRSQNQSSVFIPTAVEANFDFQFLFRHASEQKYSCKTPFYIVIFSIVPLLGSQPGAERDSFG